VEVICLKLETQKYFKTGHERIMMKNKITMYSILAICVIAILVISLYFYFQNQEKTNPIITVAKEHLQKYVHNAFPNVDFFSMVKKVEVVEGECEANHYWEKWGQPPIESPSKHQCWIVKFYYPGPAKGSYLAVHVDKDTSEVIGGTQTR